MGEDFLQYIWKFQLFNKSDLLTTNSEKLEIIKVGLHNFDSGPDFFNGQIRIDETRWAGNIEVHLKSSDWAKHGHRKDRAYDKVILHVVWEDDKPVKRQNGEPIPTVELRGRVKKNLIEKKDDLLSNLEHIPCSRHISSVNSIAIQQMLDRCLLERLEGKVDRLEQVLNFHQGDWEQLIHHQLFRYFGFKVNAQPFELLASSIPLKILRKHQASVSELEALLFGLAGFLEPTFEETYPKELRTEYNFLKAKYELKGLSPHLWKFSRLRPSNFPTLRISQLAAILKKNQSLFQNVIAAQNIDSLYELLAIQSSSYWESHYQFEKLSSKSSIKKLGKNSKQMIIINVFAPIIFFYGKSRGEELYQRKAIEMLEKLPAETNRIINLWKRLKLQPNTAYESQGLLQLQSNYCNHKKCLNCVIGSAILK